MTQVISVSMNEEDMENLQKVKMQEGLGATGVMRVGIMSLLMKPRILAEQEEMRQNNARLVKKIQALANRIRELEVEGDVKC